MAIYTYTDSFLIDDVDNLDDLESKCIIEVSKLTGSTDEFIVENLVVNRVYMLIAKENLEGDGYKDKYDLYKKEFEYYRGLASSSGTIQSKTIGVSSITIGRS